jgi:crossover junction endodeoxyribonuclease RuvC
MRIIGIDPGTGITGFGLIEHSRSDQRLVDGGVIRTPSNTPLEHRLLTIYHDLTQIIKDTKPDIVSVEKLFFAQNVTTAISVSHARGVILLAATQAKLPLFEYTPLQIKQALTGYGRASKNQVQEMVKVILNLDSLPQPDDCADALATAICHGMTIRFSRP